MCHVISYKLTQVYKSYKTTNSDQRRRLIMTLTLVLKNHTSYINDVTLSSDETLANCYASLSGKT